MVNQDMREVRSFNLARIIKEKNISPKRLSEMTGRSMPYISGILRMRDPNKVDEHLTSFGEKIEKQLSKVLGVDVFEFRKPIPMEIENIAHISDNVEVEVSKSALIDEFALIPKYKTRLSGGSGSLETSDQIEANLAFRKDWLNSRNVAEKDLALFEVVGDSMAPCISHGSIVMVDRSQDVLENIIDGKIYAFREDNVVKIKRIWIKKRSMVYESDNEIEGDKGELYFDEDDFEIFGRVIWVAHEVR